MRLIQESNDVKDTSFFLQDLFPLPYIRKRSFYFQFSLIFEKEKFSIGTKYL